MESVSVGGNSFLTLLNPAMSFVFMAAFVVVWLFARRHRYLLLFALTYSLACAGYASQYFAMSSGSSIGRFISNMVFMAAAAAMVAGLSRRYERKIPVIALAAITIVAAIAYYWFMYVQPSTNWRIHVINFGIGGMVLVAVREVLAFKSRKAIDNALLGVLIVNGALYVLRSPVLIGFVGADLDPTAVLQSNYWLVFTLTNAVISFVLVLALLSAVAVDAIDLLKSETHTDPLSNLLNRRGFELASASIFKDPRRASLPVSLILADLDHFKSVNDSHGHDVGDAVIASFAGVLRDVVGSNHPVGRIGGEEFAAIVHGADLATARMIAEGVRAAYSSAPLPFRSLDQQRLTASFGVAEWDRAESLITLAGRADAALYEAKRAGRDCVRLADVKLPVNVETTRHEDLERVAL